MRCCIQFEMALLRSKSFSCMGFTWILERHFSNQYQCAWLPTFPVAWPGRRKISKLSPHDPSSTSHVVELLTHSTDVTGNLSVNGCWYVPFIAVWVRYFFRMQTGSLCSVVKLIFLLCAIPATSSLAQPLLSSQVSTKQCFENNY